MNVKNLSLGSMIFGASLVTTHLLFSKLGSNKSSPRKPDPTSKSYGTIETYIKDQMHLLSIPGAGLAIVEGDKIAHLHGFGQARRTLRKHHH